MTPSHCRKKGVRYRYYVSQAILQSRKGDAGQVFRVPAPDIEALIERFIRDSCRDPQKDPRILLEEKIAKIIVHADSIRVELAGRDGPEGDQSSRQSISLPWSKKPFRAAKGLASAPPELAHEKNARAKDAVLAAIGRARGWVNDLMAGGSLANVAKQEDKSGRQIRLLLPLAFLSPAAVRGILDRSSRLPTIMDLAKSVPLAW
jgi:hypothetical protein